jgi:hypothetical protein
MAELYKHRLLLRILTLGILTLCLSLLSRNGTNTPFANTKESPSVLIQTQAPIIEVQTQNGTPVLITSPRILSWDGQHGEFAFELLNMSGQSVRAYAIKERAEAGGSQSSSVMFINLDLTQAPRLQPSQAITNYDTYQASSEKQQRLTLSVDYVEFSDGTKWGFDSAKSSERSAGQRAAAYLISKRLLKVLDEGTPNDVLNALESGAANGELSKGQSEEWKEGFHSGNNSVSMQLKNAQKKGGAAQVEQKLRQLADKFKGVN